MSQIADVCALCGLSTSLHGTMRAAGVSEGPVPPDLWVGYPAVLLHDGRTTHPRCGIADGLVSIGGRTGKQLLDELDHPVVDDRLLPARPVRFDVIEVGSKTRGREQNF